MVDINNLLNQSNPNYFTDKIAANFKALRLSQQLTQKELSDKSGVSLSSLRNFEQKGEISLSRLVQLAIVLGTTEGFTELFVVQQHETLNDFIKTQEVKKRQRVRKSNREKLL